MMINSAVSSPYTLLLINKQEWHNQTLPRKKIYPRAVKKYECFKLKSHFSESLKAPDNKGLQKTNGDHVLKTWA